MQHAIVEDCCCITSIAAWPDAAWPQVVFPHGVPEDVLHDTVLLHPDSVPLTFRPEVGPAPVVDPMRKEFVARLHDE